MHRLYLVPTLAINFAIILVPALLTIALAFFRWDGIRHARLRRARQFRGALRATGVFWTALTNNIIWTAIFLVVPIAMGLLAATMLLVAPARPHLLPGGLLPARGHRDGHHRAGLAGHDLLAR